MASLHVLKCSLSPLSVSKSRRKLSGNKVSNFQNHRRPKILSYRSFRVACKVQEDDNQSKGEEPPESLFMKELKKRGMTPISLLEESNRSIFWDDEMKFKEEKGGYSKRNTVTTDYEKGLYTESEPSTALNSGLKGWIPQAGLLLSLGGTFVSTFWRLIFITVASFFALYFYCGSAFVHDGSAITLPQYVDPYALLEDEMISQTASLGKLKDNQAADASSFSYRSV